MCYPKPGPRCSGHAKARLERARNAAMGMTVTQAERQELLDAQDAYDATPAGLSELTRDIAQAAGTRRAVELEGRLAAAQARRDEQIRAHKELTGRKPNDRQAEEGGPQDDNPYPVQVAVPPEHLPVVLTALAKRSVLMDDEADEDDLDENSADLLYDRLRADPFPVLDASERALLREALVEEVDFCQSQGPVTDDEAEAFAHASNACTEALRALDAAIAGN